MIKFRSIQSPIEVTPSPAGKDIYEWHYLKGDETGKMVLRTGKKNQYEQIQSCLPLSDYKSYISEDIYGHVSCDLEGARHGIYADVSAYGTSADDIGDVFRSLQSLVAQEIAKNQKAKTQKPSENVGKTLQSVSASDGTDGNKGTSGETQKGE